MLPHQVADPRWDFPGVERRSLDARPLSPQEQLKVVGAVKDAGLDLLHVPHLNAPLLSRVSLVATIHDLIPFHYPEAIAARFGGAYFHAMARLVPRLARRVLTVSEHTRQDLITLAGARPEKVETIPLGVETRFAEAVAPDARRRVRDRYQLSGRYLLYAGQWKGYKNVDLLLAVMEQLDPARFGDVKLVLVGKEDPRVPMRERLAARNLSDRVVLTGFVADDADLAALYQEATAFVFPSRYEGFGLPPLEAMAAGVPVIASDRASIPEVVGPAGLLLSPDRVLEWQRAIESLCEDQGRREALAALGRERAHTFQWDVTAARTVEAYHQALTTS
ncbi:glycosyltransferase family 4 protein [bacterium]|nr:glycosyltransferase family 4 protein [bacterium]